MNDKYLIIVEGIADAIFVYDCIKYLFENKIDIKEIKKQPKRRNQQIEDVFRKSNNLLLVAENPPISILISGGCSNVQNIGIEIFEQFSKTLIIQDADNVGKDRVSGGYKNRVNYLKELQQEKEVTFSIFLFPNNQDDGDLETLLMKIMSKEKLELFDHCYQSYCECIKKYSNYVNEFKETKSYIYNYISVHLGNDAARDGCRNYLSDLWDFESDELKPLFDFFRKEIRL